MVAGPGTSGYHCFKTMTEKEKNTYIYSEKLTRDVQAPIEINQNIAHYKSMNLNLFLKEEKLGAQTTSIGRQFHSGTTLIANEDKWAVE